MVSRAGFAIDPGTVGGRLCGWSGSEWWSERMPLLYNSRVDIHELSFEFSIRRPWLVVVEDCWVMPRQGAVSSAKFVESIAASKALAIAYADESLFPTPREWKKDLGLTKEKGASVEMFLSLFPEAAPLLETKTKTGRVSKVLDHNVAEAGLLFYWGCRQYE